MKRANTMQVLSRLSNEEFFNREVETERLYALALRCKIAQSQNPSSQAQNEESGPGEGGARRQSNALLLGAPRVGKTEILRKTFDKLFADSDDLAPIYFAFRSHNVNPERFAKDYFGQFLAQFLAFRRHNAKLIALSDEPIATLAQHASPDDYLWVRNLVDAFTSASQAGDCQALLRCAFTAPIIAASQTKVVPFIMLDNFHLLADAHSKRGDESAGPNLADLRVEFIRAFTLQGSSTIHTDTDFAVSPAYILCGLRRLITAMLPSDEGVFDKLEVIRLEPLAEEPLEQMIRATGSNLGVELSDSTTELMIQQLNRDIFYTRALLDAAASTRTKLKSFMEFERLYTEEVLRGRIGHYLDAVLRDVAADSRSCRAAIEALVLVIESNTAVPLDAVVERMSAFTNDAENLLSRMHTRELVEISFGFVQASGDTVLADYVRVRYRNEIAGARRPLAGEELLSEKLKHSYKLMMSRYNRSVEVQLIELLSRYDFQSVPSSLLDDEAYEKLYRGLSRVQVRQTLEEDSARVRLPQIVLVDDLGAGVLPTASWRMFAAKGFEGGIYSEANETLWVIALVNSKEPLELDVLQQIENRLETASRNLRIGLQAKSVRWFISKEGYSPAAKKQLKAVTAYCSTYTQLDLLYDYLIKDAAKDSRSSAASEVELIIPIEDEAELIAARTVEQIARAADFDKESINQIKTALIEACINAAEHSDSPDRKIYHRFAFEDDRLVITVSNRGKAFSWMNDDPVVSESSNGLKGSRGRGLKIIRGLMDEVRFERTDDGATLVMTKLLKRHDTQ
jgi:serine/threonine-protein kinase RsbW